MCANDAREGEEEVFPPLGPDVVASLAVVFTGANPAADASLGGGGGTLLLLQRGMAIYVHTIPIREQSQDATCDCVCVCALEIRYAFAL